MAAKIKSKSEIAVDVFIYLIIALASITFIYPIIYVFSVSVSDLAAINAGKVWLYPVGFNLDAYRVVLTDKMILRGYMNTILYSTTGPLLLLLITSLAAYPLSLKKFRARRILSIYFIITMFLNAGMIPNFILIKNLKLIDTIWAIILPMALNVWDILVLRTSFESIPISLHESAYLDGANNFRVLLQIVIPLSIPTYAALFLFSMVDHWNSFFPALLYLTSYEKMPLQNVLRKLIVDADVLSGAATRGIATHAAGVADDTFVESLKMAAIIVSIGPIILIYPFLQKYFIKGVLVGAVKG